MNSSPARSTSDAIWPIPLTPQGQIAPKRDETPGGPLTLERNEKIGFDLESGSTLPKNWTMEEQVSHLTTIQKVVRALRNHAKFIGPGIMASGQSYTEFGLEFTFETDLGLIKCDIVWASYSAATGRLSGMFAIVLQILTTRLGLVTGMDLAQHCRQLLYDRPKNTKLFRHGMLWPLYAVSEIAIFMTDIAELLGTAIAINLLIPAVSLPVAVCFTITDVLIIIIANRPGAAVKSMRVFEYGIMILVFIVFGSMAALLANISPPARDVFAGYLPSATVFQPSALVTGIGILGATVMPHGLFLGSKQGAVSRETDAPQEKHTDPSLLTPLGTNRPSLKYIRHSLPHSTWDIALSLSIFAIPINSAIVIIAGRKFFGKGGDDVADLFAAYGLVKEFVGQAAATIFAIALLCSGQSASVTASVSGQTVSEGFLNRSFNPVYRRLITRGLAIIPCMIVSVTGGRAGLNTLLILSQVSLSLILPFITFPLVFCTGNEKVMSVPDGNGGLVIFSSHLSVKVLAWTIFAIVVLADFYTLIAG